MLQNIWYILRRKNHACYLTFRYPVKGGKNPINMVKFNMYEEISLFLVAFGTIAQPSALKSARDEIRRNHCLSASNHGLSGRCSQRLTAPSGC